MTTFERYLERSQLPNPSSTGQQRFHHVAFGRGEDGMIGEQRNGTIRLLRLGADWR